MKVSNASTQNRRRELGTFFTYGACSSRWVCPCPLWGQRCHPWQKMSVFPWLKSVLSLQPVTWAIC